MSDRFVVRRFRDSGVRELYHDQVGDIPPWGEPDCYFLIDTQTNTIVGNDGGEPEDQLLLRDWRWVVVLLNELARELEKCKKDNIR